MHVSCHSRLLLRSIENFPKQYFLVMLSLGGSSTDPNSRRDSRSLIPVHFLRTNSEDFTASSTTRYAVIYDSYDNLYIRDMKRNLCLYCICKNE